VAAPGGDHDIVAAHETSCGLAADRARSTSSWRQSRDPTRELIEFVSESKSWSELAQRKQVEFVAFDVVDSR
jgi:hypothetical protein